MFLYSGEVGNCNSPGEYQIHLNSANLQSIDSSLVMRLRFKFKLGVFFPYDFCLFSLFSNQKESAQDGILILFQCGCCECCIIRPHFSVVGFFRTCKKLIMQN